MTRKTSCNTGRAPSRATRKTGGARNTPTTRSRVQPQPDAGYGPGVRGDGSVVGGSYAKAAGLTDGGRIVQTAAGPASMDGMSHLAQYARDLTHGMAAALGDGGRANDLAGGGRPTVNPEAAYLGMRKGHGGIEYISKYAPPRRMKGVPGSDLMRRVKLSRDLAKYLPDTVQSAYHNLHRLHAMNKRGELNGQIKQAEDDLMGHLSHAAAPVAENVANGVPLHTLPAADLAIYYLAAVYAATKRQYEIMYAIPTIGAVLPETVYNTEHDTYLDYVRSQHASPSQPTASTSGGIGAGVHVRQEQRTGPLHPFSQDWYLEELTVMQHEEFMDQDGAPAWTLLDETLALAAAVLMVSEAKIIAFGERPDEPGGGGPTIPKGIVYLDPAPTPIVYNTNNGVTNYDALAAFVIGQHAGTQFSPALMGDVLTLSPIDYATLSAQILNSAGGSMSVLAALLMNVAGLREIRQAREYAPNPDELTRLTDAGNPYADYYQGGIRVGGVQKRFLSLHRDNPDVVTRVTGYGLRTLDQGLQDGMYRGKQDLSTGGAKLIQPRGFKGGYGNF